MSEKTVMHGISDALGMSPLVVQEDLPEDQLPAVVDKEMTEEEKQFEEDFKVARKSLKDTLHFGENAVREMSTIARESEQPRAYEVLGNLIKIMGEQNQKLVDLHDKRLQIAPPEPPPPQEVTNNNVFVGSTSELQDMIEKARNNGKSPIDHE